MGTAARRGCVLLLVLAAGCAPSSSHAPSMASAAERTWVCDRLYFGRSMPGGGAVSDEEWAAFLRDVVTPLFPAGFTAWNAHGQWRNGDGVIIREQTFVLELMYPPRADADAAVGRIMDEYRRRFRQQSVMRVRDRVRVSVQAVQRAH